MPYHWAPATSCDVYVQSAARQPDEERHITAVRSRYYLSYFTEFISLEKEAGFHAIPLAVSVSVLTKAPPLLFPERALLVT